MKPSFLSSTLSLAFIVCVASVIVMVFMGIEPDEQLIGLISGVIGAYIGSRMPNTQSEQQHSAEQDFISDKQNAHDTSENQ